MQRSVGGHEGIEKWAMGVNMTREVIRGKGRREASGMRGMARRRKSVRQKVFARGFLEVGWELDRALGGCALWLGDGFRLPRERRLGDPRIGVDNKAGLFGLCE